MRSAWPALPFASWSDTLATLHRWSQIVGKIRLAQTPLVNHWWNVGLQVGTRGLSTGPMPFSGGLFEIELDLLGHEVAVRTSGSEVRRLPLVPRSVAAFHAELFDLLASLGIQVRIGDAPQEIAEEAIPLSRDELHRSYDPAAARTWLEALHCVLPVFEAFRARFLGKCSPVLFYWGSFDLSVSRYSGRPAPIRPGAGPITREAASHEASTAGFWPGTAALGGPAFFAYFAPEPLGVRVHRVEPDAARYDEALGEWILRYDDIRDHPDREALLLSFLQSTWEVGARLGNWDRDALERGPAEALPPAVDPP